MSPMCQLQVNIWDTANGNLTPACSLEAAAGSRVRSIAASADGATAVVVLFDSSVAVWDLRRRECTRVLQKRGQWHMPQVHSGGVNAGYLSPDAKHVLTASKVSDISICKNAQHRMDGLPHLIGKLRPCCSSHKVLYGKRVATAISVSTMLL